MSNRDAWTKPPPAAPPARKLGIGKIEVPPKGPPRPQLRSSPVHEPTVPGGAAPMATKAAPEPPLRSPDGALQNEPLDTLKRAPAPPPPSSYAPIPAPSRSLSPPPESGSVRFRAGDVDVKLGKPFLSRLRGWILPVLVSVGLSVAGLLLGYYQGLKAAGARMRAAEGRTRELAAEMAELRAVHDTKLRNFGAGLAREGVLTSDHEERLNNLKPRLELLEQRVTDLSKQKAIIVRPTQ